MTKRREALWVAELLLLGFAVRWLPAFYPHYWFDEMFTIALARESFGDILRLTAADMHPPLYYDWVKCFTMAGSGLGGPFTTLAWLRLASILPGMMACVLGWAAARRYWGRQPALWVLGAFVVSPALTYYSVDLRSYSMLHALLLGALIGYLRATDPRPQTRRGGMALFTVCALGAFYTHSLSTLYLGAFGLVFCVDLWRSRRGDLARRGAAVAGILTLACAPWLGLMFPQTASLNGEKWLGWARWEDLRATLCWYWPFGPWNHRFMEQPWPWLVMPLIALAGILLLLNAWRRRALPLADADAPEPPATLSRDRLLTHSMALAAVPVLGAFVLSYFHIAKVFLGNRYNLVPAPFITLALVGLILRIGPRGRRVAAFGALLAIWAGCSGLILRQRLEEFDIIGQAARARPEILKPKSRLAWNNPSVLPWLGRCRGRHRIESIDEMLEGRDRVGADETIYLLTHLALDANYCGLLHPSSYLLREILKRREVPKDRVDLGAWDGVWRLKPDDVPSLAAELKTARDRIEARRRAIAGGQVLLADDHLFNIISGWGPLQYGPELLPERWSEGPRPRITWSGPSRPGAYKLRLLLRRPEPFPKKEVLLRYRLPGQKHWRELMAGMGRVAVEGEVRVRAPGEQLRISLETPTFIPAQCHSNTLDDRHLGLVFEALEMQPL